MHLSVYLALTCAVALSLSLPSLTRRLAPKAAAISLALGSVTAGIVWVAGLAFIAVATVGRLRVAGALGRWSVPVLDAHDPVPRAAGAISLFALTIVLGTLTAATLRLVRGSLEVRRLHLATRQDRCGDLSIIDDPSPEAVALPGWRGSVVVTSGMLRALDARERQALLAHERSHLRSGHWAYRLATRLGAALLPTSRPLVERCDQSLERWADEHAAHTVGDRHVIATAVAKAALATTDHQRSTLMPAFSDGAVAERVEAMLSPSRRSTWGLATLAAVIGVLAIATLLHAGHDLEALFDLARVLR